MQPRRRSRRSWPILMERFFKIAFRDVLFWKRCVKCTDLDSDGHIRNGYGQESSKPDWYVSVQIRPVLDLNSDSLYGLDWTSMDFGQNHLKSWIGLYGLLWKERRARSRPSRVCKPHKYWVYRDFCCKTLKYMAGVIARNLKAYGRGDRLKSKAHGRDDRMLSKVHGWDNRLQLSEIRSQFTYHKPVGRRFWRPVLN